MDNGWETSADAWIAHVGDQGDPARRFVLDRALMSRIAGRGYTNALDVGCGEGRLCRILQTLGLTTTGLDPTPSLLKQAHARDASGAYIQAPAEDIPCADHSFDLVVSCLSLIDIADYRTAIAEMARVLKPGGSLLIVNLTAMNTASAGLRWQKDLLGNKRHFAIDNYMQARSSWEDWRGIRIQNWHRPLSAYMQAFLGEGLVLTDYDEPLPHGGDPQWVADFTRVPWFVVMEWRKDGASA